MPQLYAEFFVIWLLNHVVPHGTSYLYFHPSTDFFTSQKSLMLQKIASFRFTKRPCTRVHNEVSRFKELMRSALRHFCTFLLKSKHPSPTSPHQILPTSKLFDRNLWHILAMFQNPMCAFTKFWHPSSPYDKTSQNGLDQSAKKKRAHLATELCCKHPIIASL